MRLRTFFLLLLTTLFWGGAFPAGKLAVSELPPFTVGAIRFLIASLFLCAFLVLRQEVPALPLRRILLLCALGITGIFGYSYFFFTGLSLSSAVDSVVIISALNPFLTGVLAWALLGEERLTGRRVSGLLLSTIGVILVVGVSGGEPVSGARLVGDLLFLGAVVCWSLYSVLGKITLRGLSPLAATTGASVTGLVLLFPFALREGAWGSLVRTSVVGWVSIFYLALCATVLGFLWWYEGIREIGAGRASAFFPLVPVFGVLSSVGVLRESVTAVQGIGMGIVVYGLWLAQTGRGDTRRGSPPREES